MLFGLLFELLGLTARKTLYDEPKIVVQNVIKQESEYLSDKLSTGHHSNK